MAEEEKVTKKPQQSATGPIVVLLVISFIFYRFVCTSGPKAPAITSADVSRFEREAYAIWKTVDEMVDIWTEGAALYDAGQASRADMYSLTKMAKGGLDVRWREMGNLTAPGKLGTVRSDYSAAVFCWSEGMGKIMLFLDSGKLADKSAAEDKFRVAQSLRNDGDRKLAELRANPK